MALRLANQYSTDFLLWTTCATETTNRLSTLTFGFEASALRITNYAGVPLHLNLASTAAATTNDPELYVGERFRLDGVPVSGLSLLTTSTTTSTDASGQRVVISAWGGV